MGTKRFEPSWWNKGEHGGAWQHVKDAMRRDWEQTRRDFKHALKTDKDRSHKRDASAKPLTWNDVEGPLSFGYAARGYYGSMYPTWNDKLDNELRSEWERSKANVGCAWEDVRSTVRRGFEAARPA